MKNILALEIIFFRVVMHYSFYRMIINIQIMPSVPPFIHDFSLLSHTISGPEFQHQTLLGGTHPREHHLPPFSSPKYSLQLLLQIDFSHVYMIHGPWQILLRL